MQAEWTADREPLPHWLEELEDQASAARLELERDQAASKLEELESLLENLPDIFERKFSQRLAPVLDEVASAVPDVKFGKVDATIETALRDQYTVKGYPTLLVMRGGKTREHRGQRSKSGLMSLLERMQGPAVREVADPADLRAAIKPVLFLLGRDHDAAEPAHAVFEAVASSRQHADDFAAAEADEVLDAVGLAATVGGTNCGT